MSGTGQSQGAPTRLTPVAPDQPIGTAADGGPVLPTPYFAQMIARILAYLGQPISSGSTASGSSAIVNKTLSESLSILSSQVSSVSYSSGQDTALTQVVADLTRASIPGFPGNDSGAIADWSLLPAEARELPLAFIIPGQPATGKVFNLAAAMPMTLAAAFAGLVFFCSTTATANATFTVNQISAGVTTAIGTVRVNSGSHTSVTLTAAAATTFAIGDVLQIVAPTQDATLADMCFTFLAAKV